MVKILTWVLFLVSSNGQLKTLENISTFEGCERLRIRAEEVAAKLENSSANAKVMGTCTQVELYVPGPLSVQK